MAKYFIYPDPNIYDTGAVVGGTFSAVGDAVTFTANTATIANIERIVDQNISLALGNVWSRYEIIQIDLSSQKSPNVIALYHPTAEQNDLLVYASNSSTGYDSSSDYITTFTTDHPANDWNVFDVTITNKRYIYIYNGTDDYYAGISEMVLGTKFTFDRNYDLGGKFGKKFGVTNTESYGGVEYSHKRHNGKELWEWEWTRLTNAQMNSLITIRDAVEGSRFKFLYYDGSDWNWIRMSNKSLQKKEIAYQTFNTNIQLTQQLS